jgi:hypothetical protein
MKTILVSVAGVDDKILDLVWDNFPNFGLAITSIGITAYLVYKVVTFFTALKQSVADVNNNLISFKAEVAAKNAQYDKGSEVVKEKVSTVDVRLGSVETNLVKTDAKIESLHLEMNFRFEKVDDQFIGLRKEMNLKFEKADEKFAAAQRETAIQFAEVNRRFNSLENKMDKVIDILSSNREDKTLSSLRKS